MDGFLTVGQPAAVGAVHAMLATHAPHAVLLAGPPSVGKHSLALDLAAGLLCAGAPGRRPAVPRLSRVSAWSSMATTPTSTSSSPRVPGGQVGIGGKDGKRGVRDLVTELSLLPWRASPGSRSSATPSA